VILRRHGCHDVRQAVLDTLRYVDVLGLLRSGGLTPEDEEALRTRMLSPPLRRA